MKCMRKYLPEAIRQPCSSELAVNTRRKHGQSNERRVSRVLGFFFVNFCFLIGSSCYEVRAHWSRQKKLFCLEAAMGSLSTRMHFHLSAIVLSFPTICTAHLRRAPFTRHLVQTMHQLHSPLWLCSDPRFNFLTALLNNTTQIWEVCKAATY